MAFLTKKNFARGSLASGITAVATQVTLTAGHTLPTSGSFRAIIWSVTTYPYPPNDPNMEVVTAVLNTGNVYDIIRAQEGTSASAHATSDRMALELTAGQIQELETIDAVAGTGSMRTLGTGSQQACSGNDGRLSNARPPTGHENSHTTGGVDAFLVTDILESLVRRVVESGGPTNLAIGAVPDGRFLQRSGTAIVGGGRGIAIKTAAYTLLGTDETIFVNAAATITLPIGSTVAGGGVSKLYIIKNIHASTTTTVAAGTAETINGGSAAGTTLLLPGQAITLITDGGTDWKVVASSQSKMGTFSKNLEDAKGGTQVITGVGFKPKRAYISGAVNGGAYGSWGNTNELSSGVLAWDIIDGVYRAGEGAVSISAVNNANATHRHTAIMVFNEDGGTLTWTKTGSPVGTWIGTYLMEG